MDIYTQRIQALEFASKLSTSDTTAKELVADAATISKFLDHGAEPVAEKAEEKGAEVIFRPSAGWSTKIQVLKAGDNGYLQVLQAAVLENKRVLILGATRHQISPRYQALLRIALEVGADVSNRSNTEVSFPGGGSISTATYSANSEHLRGFSYDVVVLLGNVNGELRQLVKQLVMHNSGTIYQVV